MLAAVPAPARRTLTLDDTGQCAALILQLLFGGSINRGVGKGIGLRVLAGPMLARWSFTALGRGLRLDDRPCS
jgi:hypothetical protein